MGEIGGGYWILVDIFGCKENFLTMRLKLRGKIGIFFI
jgi:hypothetical protein